MELVKNSTLCLIQPHHPYYNETEFVADASENEKKSKNIIAATSPPSSISSPSSTNSEEAVHNSLINFNSAAAEGPGYGHFAHAAASLFSFQRSPGDYSVWEDNLHYSYQNLDSGSTSTTTAAIPFGWLSAEANANAANKNGVGENGKQEPEPCLVNKRPFMGESTQASKKQCNVNPKTPKSKPTASASASKDPQSVAAKNRRERISERLKILQDLVPNGSKVDLVTMLEKAISYVKFLQLQVKVLATDEFWPAQGAKAPDLSQVKEAIDAILASSQRDRNSSAAKS